MSASGASRLPRASLKSFLATARKTLSSAPPQRPSPLTFVVGNESADLDSLCSALLLAYLRTHAPPHHALHIPLSNLPRADLALRPELAAVLAPAGLTAEDLITVSDLPPPGELEGEEQKEAARGAGQGGGQTRWLLVDHNAPTGEIAKRFFGPEKGVVVGCIDHRDDEGFVPQESEVRVIERCGSCASLVVEECKTVWEGLIKDRGGAGGAVCEDGTSTAECDAHLARLALAPILVDTAALEAKDKTTERDVRAVEWVEKTLRDAEAAVMGRTSPAAAAAAENETKSYDRGTFYATLTRLKSSLRGLSYRDVLRKDYKRWSEGGGGSDDAAKSGSIAVGISSIPRSLRDTIREAGDGSQSSFLSALQGWADEQRLDVAAVMTVFPAEGGGGIARELVVWGLNSRGAGVLGEFVRRFQGPLGLEKWEEGELDEGGEGEQTWRVCWRQGETRCSRKQVAPMLREAMRVVARL